MLHSAPEEKEKIVEFDKIKYHWYNIYGVSGASVRKLVAEIGPGTIQPKYIETKCCGMVRAGSALPHDCAGGDCGASGGDCGSGEGLCFCLLLSVLLMAVVAVVWAVVMIVFSFVTIGGFVRRRYRTALFVERPHPVFLAKLSLAIASREGVLDITIGDHDYDEWTKHMVQLFKYLKYIRQMSIFLGWLWGSAEIYFKLRNIFDPSYHYNLWPFRLVMVLIFIPLIFSSPVLEIKIRAALDVGKSLLQQIELIHPEYSPHTQVDLNYDLQKSIDNEFEMTG